MKRLLDRLTGRADLAFAAPDDDPELWLDGVRFDWADQPGIRSKTGPLFNRHPYTWSDAQ